MKKKFISALAAVLSATLLFGTVAFAASSPSTTTSSSSSSSSTTTTTTTSTATEDTTTTVSASEQYVTESVAALSGEGTEAVVGTVLVSADYSKATNPDATLVVSTSYTEQDSVVGQLLTQINAILPGGYQVSEDDVFDVTLRDRTNDIIEGDDGLYSFSFGVGNEYDGYILTVYVWTSEGLVPYQGTVVKGKLVIEDVAVTELVRFYIAKPPVGALAQ